MKKQRHLFHAKYFFNQKKKDDLIEFSEEIDENNEQNVEKSNIWTPLAPKSPFTPASNENSSVAARKPATVSRIQGDEEMNLDENILFPETTESKHAEQLVVPLKFKYKRCTMPLSAVESKKTNSDVFLQRGKSRTAIQITCSHPFCKHLNVGFCTKRCYNRFHDLLKSKNKTVLQSFFKNDICIHVQKGKTQALKRVNILKEPKNWLIDLMDYEKSYKTFFTVASKMNPTIKTRGKKNKRKSRKNTNHPLKRRKQSPPSFIDLRETDNEDKKKAIQDTFVSPQNMNNDINEEQKSEYFDVHQNVFDTIFPPITPMEDNEAILHLGNPFVNLLDPLVDPLPDITSAQNETTSLNLPTSPMTHQQYIQSAIPGFNPTLRGDELLDSDVSSEEIVK